MNKMITVLALGVALGMRALAQDPVAPPAARTDAPPSAEQIDRLNKQLEEMRKQLDATQAQIKTLKGSNATPETSTVAPEAPPAPPAPPAPAAVRVTRDSVSRLGGSYTVGEDETVTGDARVVGGELTVDGIVRGDASAIGGSVRINGEVDGDAIVTGGSMYLGPDAVVRGKVSVTGGSLNREEGSQIGGSVRVTGGSNAGGVPGPRGHLHPFESDGALFNGPFPLHLALMLLVVGALLLTACPKRIDTIGRAFINQPMYSLLVGLASIPLAIVLFFVSIITIVGPVLVTFAMIAAFIMGMVAISVMLGRRIALGKTYRSRLFPLIVGLGVWLLASAVSQSIGPALAVMSIATAVATMMALGAAIGTGWGKTPGWLKNRMEGNRGGTPWVDPNYTYAGTQDAYKDIA
ncbi:MAG TPA: polymer-forming cytoskeletal protein [Armatimonadota bacterium]|jgi:cytoskeletal protein CcmA (bactofilin family)